MIRKASMPLLLAGIGLPLLFSPALADNGPGEGFDVTSYKLALSPDVQNKTVAGRETITLRATSDGIQRLSFSGNTLSIDNAALDGIAVIHNSQGGVLNFDLPKPLARGLSVKLELSYHGRPHAGSPALPRLSTQAISPAIGWSVFKISLATKRPSRSTFVSQPGWARYRLAA